MVSTLSCITPASNENSGDMVMYSSQWKKNTHTHYNKSHIHGHASLKDFPYDLLIFFDLLSYENRNLFLSGYSTCSFTIFFTYQKSFDVFWNFFLEENKDVHKLVARTAIRQSLWLEKNNYPHAGLFRVCSTTQPTVKIKKKRLDAEK